MAAFELGVLDGMLRKQLAQEFQFVALSAGTRTEPAASALPLIFKQHSLPNPDSRSLHERLLRGNMSQWKAPLDSALAAIGFGSSLSWRQSGHG